MFTRSRRRIDHEILDEQTPEEGRRSLRDLVRINRYLGGHEALRAALRRIAPEGPFTVLDIGAASGDSGEVIRASFPQASVTSLDYKTHHLRKAAHPKVAGDAFRLPFRADCFDIVTCSLFLHHFTDEQVVTLLRDFDAVARRAVIVNDLERHWLAYYFLPATRWLFGWDKITLHDGPISVQAAFTEHELRALAAGAGLRNIYTRVHRPAFRITLVAGP
jgi:2-polyprenyl-3-methyl-5-hydroxy-6-metoxy-1,4-benzoquinol methylase